MISDHRQKELFFWLTFTHIIKHMHTCVCTLHYSTFHAHFLPNPNIYCRPPTLYISSQHLSQLSYLFLYFYFIIIFYNYIAVLKYVTSVNIFPNLDLRKFSDPPPPERGIIPPQMLWKIPLENPVVVMKYMCTLKCLVPV